MYILYKETKYNCECHPSTTMIYRGLPEDFPVPVEGIIALCADDGFVMRVDNPADYLRQIFEDGVLTLTNVPEPVEPEEPIEPVDPETTLEKRVSVLEESSAEIAEALDMILSGVTE